MTEATLGQFQHVNGLEDVPKTLRNGVVAIGNFDGVHRGHRAVLGAAQTIGHREKRPVYAMTFEPHPRTVFKPDAPVFRLTPEKQKAEVLAACGLDGVLVVPFSREFAGVEAQEFVSDILMSKLAIFHAVTGHDFHFGRARMGTPEFLKKSGLSFGFGVTQVEPETDEGRQVISSSRIREALAEGDIALANGLLGYRWFFDAEVRHGDKRGRDLGYPTANLQLPIGCPLKHGIYAVKIRVEDHLFDGVASFGRRPTFDNGAPLFEIHLFDFQGDLYGKKLRTHVVSYLRGEEKFDSAETLVAQMDKDSLEARAALSSLKPLGEIDTLLMPGA
ncbi:riboflavin kinase/FMN adenylyltransferase [Roseibium hamelinense]|uniref:Riboflavin biosynthesis protein n=1 Tax=Roseibium hamelinense TaxID=150831 RepID=A0A562T2W9_9HYPH|nr:bifunctional riboflavin kinase/FAD synthetase [Roseibium hamelinense]MTI43384.1 bifunctional riboflavin kinase/FAD synthetase [Roseibium hamelinense]TWI87584.1 riboflavin kinase/FMN adenylyltransferase [Roseibium hamelinense]